MIIIDTETTGVDPKLNSLLSIGAIEFENPSNRFYGECHIFEGAHVHEEALRVTGFTDQQIKDKTKLSDKKLVLSFIEWSKTCKDTTCVGENPSFDRDFIHETCKRYGIMFPFAYRTIDIHSIAYGHCLRQGREIPKKNNHSGLNLDTTLALVGLGDIVRVHHNALEDTLLEAEAFSRLIFSKKLLPEYQEHEIPETLHKEVKK
jgi:DNA polymerase-3 subunit epsilon